MSHYAAEIPQALRSAGAIVAFTGAGVSAESGVPTFRDALVGLWSRFNPEDLANPEAFARDPQTVSRWYDQRRCNVANCRPNAGHLALARLEHLTRAQGRKFTLITQNVDRLHQAAASREVLELHGTLFEWRCVVCGRQTEETGAPFSEYPPRCVCGGFKRPGVVWFGESLPHSTFLEAQMAAASCDMFLSLGTSSLVQPAAGLIDLALFNAARVLEINTQETPYSHRVTWHIRGRTGEVLPLLMADAFEK